MPTLRQAIEDHWRRIFHFSFRMTLDRERAAEATEQTFIRAFVGSDKMPAEADEQGRWLIRIATHLLEKKIHGHEVTFDLLDDSLRSEATRTSEVQSLTEPQRNFLLWELKQGCMTAVVNCLSSGERVAFVLGVIFGMSDEEAARTLGITPSALKVRLSRARKKVTDYLAPRCEHVDQRNPCHCPSRVGAALRSGFLPAPPNAAVNLRNYGRYGSGLDEDVPMRDVVAIYQSLPEPDAPPDLGASLIQKLESGAWAQYRNRSASSRRC